MHDGTDNYGLFSPPGVGGIPPLEPSVETPPDFAPPQSPVSPEEKPDLHELLPHTFARMNKQGLIEIIDMFTGEIVCHQTSTEDLLKGKSDRLVKTSMPDGTAVYIEKGLSLDLLSVADKHWRYSHTIADLICQKLTEGWTMKRICETPGFPPYSQLARWRRDHLEFREKIVQAKQDRAEHFHDKVIEVAEDENNFISKEGAIHAKTKIDAFKWAAGVGNPQEYGNKTTLTGDKGSPIGFIVETGIRRLGDRGFEQPVLEGAQAVPLEVRGERAAISVPSLESIETPVAMDAHEGDPW